LAEQTQIAYRLHGGGGSQTERPPLVLIHGAGGSRLHWPSELRRLQGETVYSLDLPGHGDAGGAGERSIEGYVEHLLGWMDATGLARVVLCGHSMGGAIALTCALRAPDRLEGLILVGSGARLRVHPTLIESTSSPAGFQGAVDLIQRWAFSDFAPPQLVEQARKRLLEVPHRVLHADFLACDGFDVCEKVRDIKLPVLVLCGDQDRMTPLNYSRYLQEHIEGAELVVVEQAGHMVMLEQPAQVTQSVAGFMARAQL
jgi:pimeloyl-ACP methyl ester carboxylesterase